MTVRARTAVSDNAPSSVSDLDEVGMGTYCELMVTAPLILSDGGQAEPRAVDIALQHHVAQMSATVEPDVTQLSWTAEVRIRECTYVASIELLYTDHR